MASKYLIGLDIGTSGAKCILVDDKGAVLASSTQEYPLSTPKPGWAEQNPQDWWDAVVRGLKVILPKANVPKEQIAGVSFSGQMHGLVALDKDLNVIRPAILWCDSRTQKQCDWITEKAGGLSGLLTYTNNQMLAGYTGGKLIWFKEEEPELFAKMTRFICPKDYIRLKVCGELAIDASDASGTGFFNTRERVWADDLIALAGLDKAIFPDVLESTDLAGRVTRACAEETGLPEGLPVYAGGGDAVIQTTETGGEPGFLVRTTTTSAEDATARANQVAEALGMTASDFEVTTIGPDWGASVIQSSLIAFLVSILLIIVYIAIRFEYKMGVMAIVALFHDLILVVGIYALVGREVNPNTIAALLTILGYSLYDTVVVFHRINDNMKGEDIRCTFMTMANHSMNQVFIRTINTTLTSFIPVFAMLLFGGETLKDFAFAMAIGLIAGSYSSIAIACPLYCMWKTREPKFAKLQKKYGTEVGLFEFDHSASTGIAQVPLARLEANARAEAYVAEQKEATGEAPDAAAVAAAAKPKPVNNKKKKHRHGRAQ